MAERLVKYWFCDHCGRSTKRNVMPPSGWHEASDYYGNTSHSCPDPECLRGMRAFWEGNGITLPATLELEAPARCVNTPAPSPAAGRPSSSATSGSTSSSGTA